MLWVIDFNYSEVNFFLFNQLFQILIFFFNRRGLKALHRIGLLYVCSSFSLDTQDRALSSARVAVLFSILQCFDGLLRIIPESPEISPLASVLIEQLVTADRPYRVSIGSFQSDLTFLKLFPRMIFHRPEQLHLAEQALSYFTDGVDVIDSLKLPPFISLFEWVSDSDRQLTQFRVEASDIMMTFTSRVYEFQNKSISKSLQTRAISLSRFAQRKKGGVSEGETNVKKEKKEEEEQPSSVPAPPTRHHLPTSNTVTPSPHVILDGSRGGGGGPPPAPAPPSSGGGVPPPPPPPSGPSQKGPPPPPAAPPSGPSRSGKIPPPPKGSPTPPPPGSGSEMNRRGIMQAIKRAKGDPTRLPQSMKAKPPTEAPKLSKEEEKKVTVFRDKLDLYCANEAKWERYNCPEFAYLRDLTFLTKLSMEPMDQLLEKNPYLSSKKLKPSNFVAVWHHQDANLNVAKVGVHIADQRKLGISSEHPKSPVEPDRFVPPTISEMPQKPHILALMMFGFDPAKAEEYSTQKDPKTAAVSEEDIQHMSTIPTFNGSLSPHEVIELASLLTVPFTNVPLVLSFFTNAIGSLLNRDLQHILESVLFEPRHFNPQPSGLESVPVPLTQRERQFGTRKGVLVQELSLSPSTTLSPLRELLVSGTRLCIGDHRSSFAILLLFLTRTAIRVALFWVWILSHPEDSSFSLLSDPLTSELLSSWFETVSSSLTPKLELLLSYAVKADDTGSQVLIRSHLIMCGDLLMEMEKIFVLLEREREGRKEGREEEVGRVLDSHIRHTAYVISWHSKGNDEAQKLTEIEVAPQGKVSFFLSLI